MRRNFDLIRALLLHYEQKPDHHLERRPAIPEIDDLVIDYHVLLLAQAGLIDFEPELTKTGRIIRAYPFGLSWAGHEFLDSIRNQTVWAKVKAKALNAGGDLPFEIIKSVALDLMKELVS